MSVGFRSELYARYVSGHEGVVDVSYRSRTFERDVVARLPIDRSARILDAGCGHGDLVSLLRRHGWTDVTGIDTSQEQVETAAKLGVSGVIRADIHDFAAMHPGHYDVVLAMDVVEHFDRSEALELFRTLRAMLAAGGRLILQTPNGASPFSGDIFWSDVTHGMQYTDRSLQQICGAAGFASVRSFPTRPAVHGPVSLARSVLWRTIEAMLWIATVAETGRTRNLVFTRNLIAVARID